MNPNKTRDMSRLRKSMDWSRRKMAYARRERVESIREYVGSHYSESGTEKLVPVNFLELAIGIYARQLAANAPKVHATTRVRELKPRARKFEVGLNYVLDEINFSESQRICVLDGLFLMGIMKVGLTMPEFGEIDGYLHDAGQPFADPVMFDDWVHDMSAKRLESVQYMGDRYTLPLEFVMDSGLFDVTVPGALDSDQSRDYNEEGDARGESLSRGEGSESQEYRDRVQLWDIWLPSENLVVTLPENGDKPIRIVEWEGPEQGMYHILSFKDVPGNIMPLSSAGMWRDIHDIANRIFRKLVRQAARQKENTLIRAAATAEGDRIISANDGEMIAVDDPNNAKKVTSGGPDPNNFAFFLQTKDLFSWLGGNIDALGGLSPQSDTLGQDEMLTATASQRISDMGDRVLTWSASIIRSLGFYTWSDPLREMQLSHQVGDIDVPFVWTPDDREGDFVDYNIEVVPYSMQHQSPVTKLRNLQRVITEFYGPLMPFMQEQGVTFDIEKLNRIIARNMNLPEIEDVVRFTRRTLEDEQAVGRESSSKPAFTKRTEERISRPGSTRSGKDTAQARLLMGIGQQPAEADAIGRPTG